MILWIGSSASPQVLKDLLDVDDVLNVDPRMVCLLMIVLTPEADFELRRRISPICRPACPRKCEMFLRNVSPREGTPRGSW